jgi:hypothetical protein
MRYCIKITILILAVQLSMRASAQWFVCIENTAEIPNECGFTSGHENLIEGSETFSYNITSSSDRCLWFIMDMTVVDMGMEYIMAANDAKIKMFGPFSSCAALCSSVPTCAPDASWSDDELHAEYVQQAFKYYAVVVNIPEEFVGEYVVQFDLLQGDLGSVEPDNYKCSEAIQFCDDMSQEVLYQWGQGCLFYAFEVLNEGRVTLDISDLAEEVVVTGPTALNSCQGSGEFGSCGMVPGIPVLGPDFIFDQELVPGVYIIQVRPTIGGGTLFIDVIEGLMCIDPPPNEDCDEAVPFCDDLTVEVDPEWASNGTKCLWYTFSVSQPGPVHLDVNSPGSLIRLYGPMPPGASCEDYLRELCGSPGFIAQGTSGMGYHSDLQAGMYYVNVEIDTDTPGPIQFDVQEGIECVPCENCIPGFQLTAGQRYVVSAWTNVPGSASSVYTYTTPLVSVEAPWGNSLGTFFPSGSIIDGWQRIEGEFTMPSTGSFRLQLKVQSGTALFDDVRVFPADGSVKCYVYDPQTLRFVAELEERHYATFYEYDGEGKLTRVKKETERGIMTIQETRYSNSDRNH